MKILSCSVWLAFGSKLNHCRGTKGKIDNPKGRSTMSQPPFQKLTPLEGKDFEPEFHKLTPLRRTT